MSTADKIMNAIVYGNPRGEISRVGKCVETYNDFLNEVFGFNAKVEHDTKEYPVEMTRTCPDCLGIGKFTVDYHNPGAFDGHGQYEQVCDRCNGDTEVKY